MFSASALNQGHSSCCPPSGQAMNRFKFARGSDPFRILIEVLFVKLKVTVFILLLFASLPDMLPDCGQNQTAVSDKQYSLSDF